MQLFVYTDIHYYRIQFGGDSFRSVMQETNPMYITST